MMSSVMLLAAYSARSKAYIQALANQNLVPGTVLLFGNSSKETFESVGPTGGDTIFWPDFSLRLADACVRAGSNLLTENVDHINDARIREHVLRERPKLIIYSGYGGQIVGPDLLDLRIPILHLHAGWLPKYRGSTTIYYSWLQDGECGVSALLLNKGIDEGQLVERRKYPIPQKDIDVDILYDNAIRADLLCHVMHRYAVDGELRCFAQQTDSADVFYVIHPVLKHIALMSRGVA